MVDVSLSEWSDMSRFGFIFPGQGTQYLNMLREHHNRSVVVKETFEQASDTLQKNFWDIITGQDQKLLNETNITQPAVLTSAIALWRLWVQQGGNKPSVLAGHSLGEYSALVCAGVLDFEQALRLVYMRGQYMNDAIAGGQGKMVAVMGLNRQCIQDTCNDVSQAHSSLGLVAAVNFNSDAQTVIAGNLAAVLEAEKVLKQKGASRLLPLAVSVPSHCYLMKPAADRLEQLLATIRFNQPVVELINNVDVSIETQPAMIKAALVKQLYQPVRWSEIIHQIEQNQMASCLVEVGPGRALTGLLKRISKQIDGFSTCEPTFFDTAFAHINK